MAYIPPPAAENALRRWLCEAFAVGARLSKADLHRAYSVKHKRPLPLTRETSRRLDDIMAAFAQRSFVSAAPGPKGGIGWTVNPACAPEWVLGYVGSRLRRIERYVPPSAPAATP
ncbi:hypothetical protein [Azospirillum sp. sgz302134]